jgi:hypothetical protein
MPTIEQVYAKFGEVAEAAQLLEVELGNLLLEAAIDQHGLSKIRSKGLGKKILGEIDRKTLGQLIAAVRRQVPPPASLLDELAVALAERNRLNHAFYRQHNLRRNSDEGRMLMLADLDQMHERIFDAYKSVMKWTGIDVTKSPIPFVPATHLPR